MRDLLDMNELWQDFRRIVRSYVEKRGYEWQDRGVCPYSLEELLSDDLDLKDAEGKLVALLQPASA